MGSKFLNPPLGCTLTDAERVIGAWVEVLPVVGGPPKLSQGSDPEGKWVRWASSNPVVPTGTTGLLGS